MRSIGHSCDLISSDSLLTHRSTRTGFAHSGEMIFSETQIIISGKFSFPQSQPYLQTIFNIAAATDERFPVVRTNSDLSRVSDLPLIRMLILALRRQESKNRKTSCSIDPVPSEMERCGISTGEEVGERKAISGVSVSINPCRDPGTKDGIGSSSCSFTV